MNTIYLSVEPQALSNLQDTLVSLLEHSASAKAVVVIGAPTVESDIRKIVGAVHFNSIALEFVFSEASDHLSQAVDMAARCAGDGAFFVKSGVTVPYAWDARLKRIAQHNSKIGTVSPLCDSFPMFALLSENGSAKVAASDTRYVDSLSFSLSSRTYIEVPCFLEDCFYISPAALEFIVTKTGKKNPVDAGPFWGLARLLSANGYLNVLGDCLYVYSMRQVEADRKKFLLAQNSVQSIINVAPFKSLGLKVMQCFSSKTVFKNMPGIDPRPVQLHVQHSWGGGVERWARDYCSSDKSRINLILKSSGRAEKFGERLMLFSSVADFTPLQTWEFPLPIQGTAVSHLDYANAIDEIIQRYSIDAIFVSSLIGHSLDILNTSKPTILICHDYYPYCPAINITFNALCTNCEFSRLEQCFKENPLNHNFRNIGANDWDALREQYLSIILTKHLKLVIPSQSMQSNLVRLESRYSSIEFVVIPHGVSPMQTFEHLEFHQSGSAGLRILVLGNLAPHKGVGLLKKIISELKSSAEFFLVGCGPEGEIFERENIGRIIYSYNLDELPRIIHDINPDIALLLSVVPETFSYTLSELTELKVPVVATRLGSFSERIEDDKTGFLAAPSAGDVILKIKLLDSDRAKITRVKENLALFKSKSVVEMVEDYQRVLPLASLPIARFSIHSYGKPLQKENKLSQILASKIWRGVASLRWLKKNITRFTVKRRL